MQIEINLNKNTSSSWVHTKMYIVYIIRALTLPRVILLNGDNFLVLLMERVTVPGKTNVN